MQGYSAGADGLVCMLIFAIKVDNGVTIQEEWSGVSCEKATLQVREDSREARYPVTRAGRMQLIGDAAPFAGIEQVELVMRVAWTHISPSATMFGPSGRERCVHDETHAR